MRPGEREHGNTICLGDASWERSKTHSIIPHSQGKTGFYHPEWKIGILEPPWDMLGGGLWSQK